MREFQKVASGKCGFSGSQTNPTTTFTISIPCEGTMSPLLVPYLPLPFLAL